MKKIVLLASGLVLLSIAMSLCVVCFLGLRITYALPYTDINVETAYNMITNGSYPDLVVLDVRSQDEYDTGHIIHAVLIPHTELDERIDELASHKNHEIIVYCKTGVRSVIASEILDSHNFTKVYNMLGGITAWQFAYYRLWTATVHNVNTTIDYDTIQAAIDASETLDGHTILVGAGTYYENVIINKPISLIGEDRETTILDGSEIITPIVDITANNVIVRAFTIQDGGRIYGWEGGGIYVTNSSRNKIVNNTIKDTQYSINLRNSTKNTIIGNTMIENDVGIQFLDEYSSDSIIYHNNFIDNGWQVNSFAISNNTWDDGYPSGGNYWSDYNGTDANQDGIGDTAYNIDANNQDKYPLMGMFYDFTVWDNETYHITTICNFTISDFNWGYSMNITGTWEKALYFNVFGPEDTVGFCRIMIPRAFLEGPYTVLFTNEANSTELPISNSTHVFLYITYNHSGHVMIVPEFPTWTSISLLFIVLTAAIAIYKRRLRSSNDEDNCDKDCWKALHI